MLDPRTFLTCIGLGGAYGDVLDFNAEGLATDSQAVRYQQVSAESVQRLE